MDCFRSVRGGAADGVADVLDGRSGGADCVPPKKSSPNSESPGFVCFGGTAGAFGGGCLEMGSVVLGRCGSSPPMRSTLAAGRAGARKAGAAGPDALCEEARSIFAFSWTTFKGWSS